MILLHVIRLNMAFYWPLTYGHTSMDPSLVSTENLHPELRVTLARSGFHILCWIRQMRWDRVVSLQSAD